MRHVLRFALAGVLSVSTAALAQTQPTVPAQPAPNSATAANQVICEKEEDTGSRLSAHKVCHTRSEWQQLRREDRTAIEHVQSERSMDQNGH